ncbi:UNVERIFIED_CONTAM: hypothetical protein Scaly_1899500 [Sesamum calycinum]|uniref:Reverse transcriptase Ty1/copia-type domain-containing protein n=1 Tax=Sesamum calycinum TaxID=2727403 RepID=A0AAW2NHI7_9LAMI
MATFAYVSELVLNLLNKDLSKVVRLEGCKWVYKTKFGVDGEVRTIRTRLAAKGYAQRLEVDFEEAYSLIAIAKFIRILAIIAAYYISEIWKIDVKPTLLNREARKTLRLIYRSKATIEKSTLSVLVEEASTLIAKGKGVRRLKRKKAKIESTSTALQVLLLHQ